MKYIFIDVDGVLNFDEEDLDSFDAFADFGGGSGYPLRMNKNHGKWLLDLAEETESKLVWGTSWMDKANIHIGPKIGLPHLPTAITERVHAGSMDDYVTWKTNAIKEYAGDSIGVWFDDDWSILRRNMTDTRVRLVPVEYRIGLTLENINSARNYLNYPK